MNKIVLGCVVAIVARACIFSASIGDSLIAASLLALLGYYSYLETKQQQPVAEEFRKELDQLKTNLSALKLGKTMGR